MSTRVLARCGLSEYKERSCSTLQNVSDLCFGSWKRLAPAVANLTLGGNGIRRKQHIGYDDISAAPSLKKKKVALVCG